MQCFSAKGGPASGGRNRCLQPLSHASGASILAQLFSIEQGFVLESRESKTL